MTTRTARTAFVAITLVGAAILSGCTANDDLAAQYREGTGQGYISGEYPG